MAKLNMAKINMLIRKGYLLAGVAMAANMFIVNEVKASQNQNNEKPQGEPQNVEGKDNEGEIIPVKKSILGSLLSLENTINLVGGLALSGANNYFKWWDYNAGGYLNLRIGCIGWRSKRFLDIFQFDINLNGIRGISWSILHIIALTQYVKGEEKGKAIFKTTAGLIAMKATSKINVNNRAILCVSYFIISSLQGFVSIPLTLHFSKFSISISLDSMIWAVIDKILQPKVVILKNPESIINNKQINKDNKTDKKDGGEGTKPNDIQPNIIQIKEGDGNLDINGKNKTEKKTNDTEKKEENINSNENK